MKTIGTILVSVMAIWCGPGLHVGGGPPPKSVDPVREDYPSVPIDFECFRGFEIIGIRHDLEATKRQAFYVLLTKVTPWRPLADQIKREDPTAKVLKPSGRLYNTVDIIKPGLRMRFRIGPMSDKPKGFEDARTANADSRRCVVIISVTSVD